ncbi:MAG TPA: MarR family transcriptional regulator [Microbacteriaceae bacterium]|jgi:DNA-binding MarR family transcriptional regulator|nr:MarR family transcriptional regulator [Microbacteriaceae bacterium]
MATRDRQALLLRAAQANHELFMITTARIEAAIGELRLTYQTAHALWAIDPDEAPPSMSVMAGRLYCNAPNLTFIAKQLEARGYAIRAKDPADKRSTVLRLTPDGQRARTAVIKATLHATPFADCDDDQLRSLTALLTSLISP